MSLTCQNILAIGVESQDQLRNDTKIKDGVKESGAKLDEKCRVLQFISGTAACCLRIMIYLYGRPWDCDDVIRWTFEVV